MSKVYRNLYKNILSNSAILSNINLFHIQYYTLHIHFKTYTKNTLTDDKEILRRQIEKMLCCYLGI